MERTFHAVGQGAFYTEDFKNVDDKNSQLIIVNNEFNIVYDCGSSTSKAKGLSKEINNYKINHNQIDILFISHFHIDHINGILDLIENIKVKKVIIPFLDNYDKLMCIGSLNLADLELAKFILNPEDYFKESEKIKLEKGESCTIEIKNKNNDKWYFIAENIDCENDSVVYQKNKNNFINKLKNDGLIDENSNIIKLDKNVLKKIKSIYVDVFKIKNINNTSLLLYSGRKEVYCELESSCKKNTQCGCLYLGDIEFNGNNISNNIITDYKQYFNFLGTIQVPHHGSLSADDDNFWKFFSDKKCVISCGLTNRYHHPHNSTLITLLKNKLNINFVTETTSPLIQHYNYF